MYIKIIFVYLVTHSDVYSVEHSVGPGISQFLTKGVKQNWTGSSAACFLYSIKQLFLKFSSHFSSCCGVKSVAYVVWHFSLYECLQVITSSYSVSCTITTLSMQRSPAAAIEPMSKATSSPLLPRCLDPLLSKMKKYIYLDAPVGSWECKYNDEEMCPTQLVKTFYLELVVQDLTARLRRMRFLGRLSFHFQLRYYDLPRQHY